MRILDRYILKELLGPFLFGICAFSAVFIGGGTLFRIAQYISKYGASGLIVGKLFIYSLPGVVVLTLPMSMMLATLISFSKLSAAGEITAMRAAGQSFLRLVLPLYLAAFGVGAFSVVFNETLVPAANSAYNSIIRNEIELNKRPKTEEHIVIKESTKDMDRLIYARKYDALTDSMHGITIQEFDKGRLAKIENAETASWQENKWIMHNGLIRVVGRDGDVDRTLTFSQQIMPLTATPAEVSLANKKLEEMTITELKQQIKVLDEQKVPSRRYQVELQQRLSIPMASFIFALVGAPLGLSPQRSSSSTGMGLSILIIFIYYIFMTAGTVLGQNGTIAPLLAAWLPNLVGIAAGIWLMRRTAC